MSKAKNMARAEKGELHRDPYKGGVPDGKMQIKCLYPPCKEILLIDKPALGQPLKEPPFCNKHLEWLQFIMWAIPNIQVNRQETPSGIILPGNKAFDTTFKQAEVKP